MSDMSAPMTWGMRLDACLQQLEDLSSTQLYGIIVALTVTLCWLLLGTGGPLDLQDDMPSAVAAAAAAAEAVSPKKPSSSKSKSKQPRWHIFKYINVLATLLFVGSVILFATQFDYYYEHRHLLSHFLVGWSLMLCYFFGFFGVSLIHNELEELPEMQQKKIQQQQQQQQQQQHVDYKHSSTSTSTSISTNTRTTTAAASTNSTTNKVVVPAAACAPVCSDPASFKSNSNKKNKYTKEQLDNMSNADVAQLVLQQELKDHELEKKLDCTRAVMVRRLAMQQKLEQTLSFPPNWNNPMERLPSQPSLDYSKVFGANCEIVIGYVPLPVGLVGPLTLNGQSYYIPMATTEGCLVASTNRGAKAISSTLHGAQSRVVRDGITRAPCVRMASAMEAADLKLWCEEPCHFAKLKAAFESTTSFGKLISCQPTVAGKNVYLRLVCRSGDAMGMNMVSKGSLAVIELLKSTWPTLELVALSGNMCTDKKAAATNWLEGRGKSVVVEATIPKSVVETTLKTTVGAMVHTNLHKNLIGSAMAGALGGFNAHASNIVTAVFLATGQDPAQNVESSNCITLMEETSEGDLWMSCTMPSLEVGTVGGGTSLEAQAACLEMMGVKGGNTQNPGENAKQLAQIIAAAVLAGEMSLLAALAANTLVQAHMTHNRKPAAVPS